MSPLISVSVSPSTGLLRILLLLLLLLLSLISGQYQVNQGKVNDRRSNWDDTLVVYLWGFSEVTINWCMQQTKWMNRWMLWFMLCRRYFCSNMIDWLHYEKVSSSITANSGKWLIVRSHTWGDPSICGGGIFLLT